MQIRYASLLATKWLIERLGNRSSAGRQQTGTPSRRRRKMGRVIPVPASDHRKKGTCRLLTVQCKYLVCFYAFYYYILSSLHFAAQNVSGWTRPVQEFVQHWTKSASKGLHAPCLMLMEDSVGGFSRNWTGSRVLEKMQKEYLVKNRHRNGEGFSIS